MLKIPVNQDGSADVLGVWYDMLKQGKEGSTFRMVEGIRNIHRFVLDSRFYSQLKKGINIEILLAHEPQNEEEKKMLDEIASTSQLYERKLLFERDPARYMEVEARAAYEEKGLPGLVNHFTERIQIDGNPLDEPQAREIATTFQKQFYKESPSGGKK